MAEKSNPPNRTQAPTDRSSHARSADEARDDLERRGITEDDIVEAVRWARAFPDRHA